MILYVLSNKIIIFKSIYLFWYVIYNKYYNITNINIFLIIIIINYVISIYINKFCYIIKILNIKFNIFMNRLQEDPPTGVSGAPTDNNIMIWNAVIFG